MNFRTRGWIYTAQRGLETGEPSDACIFNTNHEANPKDDIQLRACLLFHLIQGIHQWAQRWSWWCFWFLNGGRVGCLRSKKIVWVLVRIRCEGLNSVWFCIAVGPWCSMTFRISYGLMRWKTVGWGWGFGRGWLP